ncbi:hypothetical protein B0I73DRAFT_128277, partial [Yarrowia lipolytica]
MSMQHWIVGFVRVYILVTLTSIISGGFDCGVGTVQRVQYVISNVSILRLLLLYIGLSQLTIHCGYSFIVQWCLMEWVAET